MSLLVSRSIPSFLLSCQVFVDLRAKHFSLFLVKEINHNYFNMILAILLTLVNLFIFCNEIIYYIVKTSIFVILVTTNMLNSFFFVLNVKAIVHPKI